MAFGVVIIVLLAVSYAAAAIHAKVLLGKGESSGDVSEKLPNTAASTMIIGVIVALFMWPAGKAWYKSPPFSVPYNLAAQYLKPNPKDLPKDRKDPSKPDAKAFKEAEGIYVIIRQVLLGSLICLVGGIVAQVLVKSQVKSLTAQSFGGGGGAPKSHASPWAR